MILEEVSEMGEDTGPCLLKAVACVYKQKDGPVKLRSQIPGRGGFELSGLDQLFKQVGLEGKWIVYVEPAVDRSGLCRFEIG